MEEWLPPASWQLEQLRRDLLDLYRERGYGLILPPLLEHFDALMVGAGSDLEQQTFKLVDPASGRLLGLRADMTPQASHIAARRYADRKVVRLCYLGTVLRAHPDLGHVGIYRAIASGLNLSAADEDALFEILQRKSAPDLQQFATTKKLG